MNIKVTIFMRSGNQIVVYTDSNQFDEKGYLSLILLPTIYHIDIDSVEAVQVEEITKRMTFDGDGWHNETLEEWSDLSK